MILSYISRIRWENGKLGNNNEEFSKKSLYKMRLEMMINIII